jgi:GNAT superfamily N-acetyltransferase
MKIRLVSEPGTTDPDFRHAIWRMNRRHFGFAEDAFHGGWWWAAESAGDLVGFAGALDRGDGVLFLGLCGVAPEARGRGLQRRFIAVREELARSLCFATLKTHTDAENYASANNFIRSGSGSGRRAGRRSTGPGRRTRPTGRRGRTRARTRP